MTQQPKSSLTVETSHWTSSNMDSVPLHSFSRLWDLDSKWNAKFTFIWKEDFGPLSNNPVLFLHSPGKMLLTLSLVQKWLGSPFLKTSERGDSWCTDSSFSPLLVKLSQVFESALLTVFSSLRSSLLLVHLFLPKFFFQSTLHLICFDTALCKTATPFSNDPLWLTPLCGGCQCHLRDHCQVSSVPHYCGFKEQEIPRIYTVWMDIYWNSNVNILIFWDTDFWLSWAVSSNQQN